jgi:hypothetical protein
MGSSRYGSIALFRETPNNSILEFPAHEKQKT